MFLDHSLLGIFLAMFCNIPTHFKILSLEVRLKCYYEDRKDIAKKSQRHHNETAKTTKTLQRHCKETAKIMQDSRFHRIVPLFL